MEVVVPCKNMTKFHNEGEREGFAKTKRRRERKRERQGKRRKDEDEKRRRTAPVSQCHSSQRSHFSRSLRWLSQDGSHRLNPHGEVSGNRLKTARVASLGGLSPSLARVFSVYMQDGWRETLCWQKLCAQPSASPDSGCHIAGGKTISVENTCIVCSCLLFLLLSGVDGLLRALKEQPGIKDSRRGFSKTYLSCTDPSPTL